MLYFENNKLGELKEKKSSRSQEKENGTGKIERGIPDVAGKAGL
jgi:hypothetical protein